VQLHLLRRLRAAPSATIGEHPLRLRQRPREPEPRAATRRAQPDAIDDEGWDQVRAGEYTVRVHGRGERGPQSQLRLEHAGTSVLMISDTLSRDQLIAIAALLIPAPAASKL
jgi:hypothetical protein